MGLPPCPAVPAPATDLTDTSVEEAVEGRLRRYYRLTDAGAGVLASEIERLRRNAAAAEEQLRRRPGGLATGFAYGV